jgi:hypothetical protein
MNLNYVFSNDSERLKHADAQGYDLDTLFMLAKEVFGVAGELQLTSRELAEIFYRLKNVHDNNQGISLNPDLVMYENSAANPTRLAVEVRGTPVTVCFRVLPGQKVEKAMTAVKCESCRDAEPVRRSEIKQHVLEKHM